MLVIVVIIGIILINIILCFVYCMYRKRRSVLPKLRELRNAENSDDQSVTENRSSSGPTTNKDSAKLKIIKKYIFEMEGLMRINLFATSYIPSHHIRNFLYKFVYQMDIEKKATIYYGAEIRAPWNIHIGKGSIIGDRAILDGRNGIWIDDNANLSTNVSIYTLQHDMQSASFATEGGPVVVGSRAWLSCNTIILPNTEVGEGAVVAAGAVLTKDAKKYGVYGGIPAKCRGERNNDLSYQFDGKHFHFL